MAANPDAVTIIRDHVFYDPLQARDTAPWQQLPEFPAAEELLNPAATTNDLPSFPVDTSFDSKAKYLEALYKILRFEAVEGLRYSVNEFRLAPAMSDDQNTCVYTKVFVKGYLMTKLGPLCRVSFSNQRAGLKILWKQAKRLTPGRILALSSDNFQSDCRVAIVAQRPIEGGLDQNPPTIDIIWASADQAVVDPDFEMVMIESRNGLYEAARHAMIGLQLAAGETSTFEKYLVDLDDHDRLSRSTAHNPHMDLSCLITQLTQAQQQRTSGRKELENLLFQEIAAQYDMCDMRRPLSEQGIQQYTSLDSSQLKALQRMATNELAVIQGPPGTGKTFTSVQALNIILANRKPGDPPVIVAAQTNHALDQLLIHCHSARANILRVGGRTENDVIKERTFFHLRNSLGKDAVNGRAKYRSLEKARVKIVEAFGELVDGVFGGQALLDPQALLDAGIINEAQFESLSSDGWEGNDEEPAIQTWLGEERIERIRQPPEDLEFEQEEVIDERDFEVDPDMDNGPAEDDDDDDHRLHGTWIPMTSHYTGNAPRVPGWQNRCAAALANNDDLFDIQIQLRGGVYQLLQSKLREASVTKFREILQRAVSHAKEQKFNKWFSDLTILKKHCIDIIGCTTTGLTKYRGFLAATGARVLLIEEAAETREANVTSALFPSLDQLILVGDHQQLPPNCDIARLGDEPFNLNVSLFERLVRNRLPYTMLNRQRRMAPELRYILQKYYPNLEDHPLVTDDANRPLIPGMGSRRTWFFTHEWPEDTDAENSKLNRQEAMMIVAFIKYLVQNGVKPAQITALTYYRGQRKLILQFLSREAVTLGARHFNVATVDSYQGEENEIVLLSLVRSPPTQYDVKRVGFVESLKRATVAISRARRGFFMFGNKDNLFKATTQSFDTWAPVWNGFAEQQRVGIDKGLPLVCQNHNDENSTNEIWMKSPENFVGNAGGCWIKCQGNLPCGHDCALTCHVTPHETLPCLVPCAKVLPCGHKCSGVCTDPCQCCKDCDLSRSLEAEQRMALLQREDPRPLPSRMPPPAPVQSREHGPDKWLELSKNPHVHDDAIREDRLKKAMRPVVEQPLIEFDTPPTSPSSPKNEVNERFIPISNRDGVRVRQDQVGPRGRSPPNPPAPAHDRTTDGRPEQNDFQLVHRPKADASANSRNTIPRPEEVKSRVACYPKNPAQTSSLVAGLLQKEGKSGNPKTAVPTSVRNTGRGPEQAQSRVGFQPHNTAPSATWNTGGRQGNNKQKGPQAQPQGRNSSNGKCSGGNGGTNSARAKVQGNQVQNRRPVPQNRLNMRIQQPHVPSRNTPVATNQGISQPRLNLLAASGEPIGSGVPADSVSLMGESDLGFEAEVLGIPRGRIRANGAALGGPSAPQRVQEVMGADAESLMTFGGDGAGDLPEPATQAENGEEEEELLISFD